MLRRETSGCGGGGSVREPTAAGGMHATQQAVYWQCAGDVHVTQVGIAVCRQQARAEGQNPGRKDELDESVDFTTTGSCSLRCTYILVPTVLGR
jgi:hypothetical protein